MSFFISFIYLSASLIFSLARSVSKLQKLVFLRKVVGTKAWLGFIVSKEFSSWSRAQFHYSLLHRKKASLELEVLISLCENKKQYNSHILEFLYLHLISIYLEASDIDDACFSYLQYTKRFKKIRALGDLNERNAIAFRKIISDTKAGKIIASSGRLDLKFYQKKPSFHWLQLIKLH